jgi:NADH-quinone oxidoreductase subunit M
MLDVNKREIAIFAPLIAVALWIGVYPDPFLDVMHASVTNLMEQHQASMEMVKSTLHAAK